MEFNRRKLPTEAAMKMRACEVRSVRPYALMLAPVYVYLRLNKKFVAVKAPLDFFTPEELEKLQGYGEFYFPEFIDQSSRFSEAARKIRALLGWAPGEDKSPLPPTPFELSDSILRLMGPLWGEGVVIEPFFVGAFANELCDPLPVDVLTSARDADVESFERAILHSSWAVFLALHLGHCNLGFLNGLRLRVFQEAMHGEQVIPPRDEVDELVLVAAHTLGLVEARTLTENLFSSRTERVAHKISSRLQRVKGELIRAGERTPSIHGPEGFIDA